MNKSHIERYKRLKKLLERSEREPYEWPVPIMRADLEALMKKYGRNGPYVAPQDPEFVRKVLHDRDVRKLTFAAIGSRYSMSHVAIWNLCKRWRGWAAKNPVDTPANH